MKNTARAPLRRILHIALHVFTIVCLFYVGSFSLRLRQLLSITIDSFVQVIMDLIKRVLTPRGNLKRAWKTAKLRQPFRTINVTPVTKHRAGDVACPQRWQLQCGNKQPRFFLQNVVFALLYSCYYFGSFV